MIKIKEVIRFLERIAPPALQESYDNAGLITGDANLDCQGILITLDTTEEIVDEAIEKGCNMIVAHHPIVFRGLKTFTGRDYVERTVIKAIKNDIAIYAAHTNLDNVANGGVNGKIAEKIGLLDTKILAPKSQNLFKLTTFVPEKDADKVTQALNEAGAGQIGEYKNCSFRSSGTGFFQPGEKSNPHIGAHGTLESVDECRVEVIFPEYMKGNVISALNNAHPYEEVAYYLHRLENTNQETGSGMVGVLPEAMDAEKFLLHLKKCMNLDTIRYTGFESEIRKVAVCGGSGSFLLKRAKAVGADAFVTGDFKYHEFFDAEGKVMIADIGHYESEAFTKELFHEHLSDKFPSIALYLSDINTNPVHYI
ncbi:GTP cyclohydrolase 1 type 2 [Fulvitalea axinellae]|uniref:GTP cyclohydrolase 1 type 2 homolog n=1 Tax=Fulvitalea axinellae TaxID=1182444 RepID=A0AAU9D2L8_9BACT|nr:GTP cyclohydrolase 1 type 2 [Fulvitalea axinellae]